MGVERYVGAVSAMILGMGMAADDAEAFVKMIPNEEVSPITRQALNYHTRVESRVLRSFQKGLELRIYTATVSKGVFDKYLLICEQYLKVGKPIKTTCIFDGGTNGPDGYADKYFIGTGTFSPKIFSYNPAAKLPLVPIHQNHQKRWNQKYSKMINQMTKKKTKRKRNRKPR